MASKPKFASRGGRKVIGSTPSERKMAAMKKKKAASANKFLQKQLKEYFSMGKKGR